MLRSDRRFDLRERGPDGVGRLRRGGYCFEDVTLLAAVLARLGVAARTHAASMPSLPEWN